MNAHTHASCHDATTGKTWTGMSLIDEVRSMGQKFGQTPLQISDRGQSALGMDDLDDLASMRVDAIFHGIGKTTIKRG
jgi:hypothetical protein